MKNTITLNRVRQPRRQLFRKRNRRSTSGQTGAYENGTQGEGEGEILPEFSKFTEVKAEDGFFDHMEVSAKHGQVRIDEGEHGLLRSLVGAAPIPERGDESSQIYGRMFNASPHKGNSTTVKQAETEWGGITIPAMPFSGALKTKRVESGDDDGNCLWELSSELNLNPTRGVNLCGAGLLGDGQAAWEDVLLHRQEGQSVAHGRDGNDNLIPAGLTETARSKGASSRFILAVYRGIQAELERACGSIDGLEPVGNWQPHDFSIRRVETYWEFRARDAVALVRRLAPTLRAFHKHASEREHGFEYGTQGNATTLLLFLSNGEAIRIYAKTANRIRIEVIHSPKKQNGLIPGGRCATGFPQFGSKLHSLRKRAARRVNELFSFLSDWAEESPQDRASSTGYNSAWFERLDHSEASKALLECLKTNGRLIGGRCLTHTEAKMLRRARDRGLIRSSGSCGSYYPTEIGSCLPDNLTGLDSVANTLCHKTETQAAPYSAANPLFSRTEEPDLRVPPPPPAPP